MGNVAAATPGDIIYVNSSGGNDSNNGSSWLYAKHSISNATRTVIINGIVNIANGQYTGASNTEITINKNMTIQGQIETGTIIGGTGTNWIFDIQPGINVVINDLTLTNATNSYGGAIHNQGTLTLNNDTFNNNTNTSGSEGVVWNTNGTIIEIKDTFNNDIPNREITSPLNGIYVNEVVPINVRPTDFYYVTKVVFTINGNNYINIDEQMVGVITGITGLSDGIYNITVAVYDTANNCQIQTVSVNVNNTQASANTTSGLYNSTQLVTLTMSETGTIYYTTDGTDPTISSNVYTEPINIPANTITTLKYLAGNTSKIYTQTYTIDTIPPTASANVKGGVYNTNKVVTLTMSEPLKYLLHLKWNNTKQ
jgi:hypothetical protein